VSRSPNHGPRRDGLRPELVVLHYTAMPDVASAERALCDPAREVSCHWLIARDGTVKALVDEDRRAWHAGAGSWGGREDVNSRSIGIELDNDGASPFAAPLMDALEELLGGILARWDIPPLGVIGHSDMAPGRKRDPGPRFDWQRLARGGLVGLARPHRRRRNRTRHGPVPHRCEGLRLPRRVRRAAPRRSAAALPATGAADRSMPPTAPSPHALAALDRSRRTGIGAGARKAGWPRAGRFEESPDSLKQRCRVTPGRSDPTESATEIRPPRMRGDGETVG
jgi:hypothetical protein